MPFRLLYSILFIVAVRTFWSWVSRLTLFSLHGQAKSIEDTENRLVKGCLPIDGGEEKTYRVAYAVHQVLDVEGEHQPTEQEQKPTKFIGLINLKSLDAAVLDLPEELTLPAAAAATTLTVEVAYTYLPIGWGKGYATESLNAVFEASKRAKSFWEPFSKLYVRALVNRDNPASLRVMEKTGMVYRGSYEWTGEAIFLAGVWREKDNLHIYGMYLLG